MPSNVQRSRNDVSVAGDAKLSEGEFIACTS
jgi:hypothetical protein